MAALLLLAVSCKKDKEQQIDGSGFGFRATVESHEGDSKTHLDGVAVKWDSNDEILVQSSTCASGKRFALVQIEEGGEAGFNPAETLPEGFYSPNYTAGYPAGDFTFDRSIINIELPSTQTYVENSFGNGANPMIAACGDKKMLAFKNICGLLKLQLYSATACYVDNITLTSSKSDEMLWGTGNVVLTEGIPSIPSLEGLSNGSNALTLNCNGAPMSTDADYPSSYFFVVPANTLSNGFTVVVTDTKGKTWKKTTSQNTTISRSKITMMPSLKVETVYEDVDLGLPNGLLWATFNVGARSPEQFGDYFQWGATTPLAPTDDANWSICPFNDGSSTYNDTYFRSVKNTVCPSNVLALDYDAARASWGGVWRMPTADEWQELFDNTTHEWTTQNGVNGWLFTGTKEGYTNVTLFLPAAGCHVGENISYQGESGSYWSSSLNSAGQNAHFSSFTSGNFNTANNNWGLRIGGYSVRPVREAR